MEEFFDTGLPELNSSGFWVVNPKSELPLRIGEANQKLAVALKSALERGFSLPADAESAALQLLSENPQVFFPEVEAFIKNIAGEFEAAVNNVGPNNTDAASPSRS